MNKEYLSEWAKEKAANIILQQPHLSTPLCKHHKIGELIDVVIERAIGLMDTAQPVDAAKDNSPCNCPSKESCLEFDGDGGCVLLSR